MADEISFSSGILSIIETSRNYALFQMEEKLGLKVMKKDGCYCLQFSGLK